MISKSIIFTAVILSQFVMVRACEDSRGGVNVNIYYPKDSGEFIPVFTANGKKIPFSEKAVYAYAERILSGSKAKLDAKFHAAMADEARLKNLDEVFKGVEFNIRTSVQGEGCRAIGTEMEMYLRFNEQFYTDVIAKGYKDIQLSGVLFGYGMLLKGEQQLTQTC